MQPTATIPPAQGDERFPLSACHQLPRQRTRDQSAAQHDGTGGRLAGAHGLQQRRQRATGTDTGTGRVRWAPPPRACAVSVRDANAAVAAVAATTSCRRRRRDTRDPCCVMTE
ncbi:hypothetical protein OAN61_00550 [bacterium]|nr:hypothetical protein [bacterium]